MASQERLQRLTRKELVELARQRKIRGYSRMTKEELIAALTGEPTRERTPSRISQRRQTTTPTETKQTRGPRSRAARSAEKSAADASQASSSQTGEAMPARQRSAARLGESGVATPEEQVETSKYEVGVPTRELSPQLPRDLPAGYGVDRLVLLVRDPFWLHAYWELTPATIERAAAALGAEWHGSRPALRLVDVTSGDSTPTSETVLRDIPINDQARNWYIEVSDPPRSFRVDLGYLTPSGRFHTVLRSNVVTTPRAGVSERIDEAWADLPENYERILAMSAGFQPGTSSEEVRRLIRERLQRPLASGMLASMASEALARRRGARGFWFQVEAELIVYGATEPGAKVTLQGEPVTLRPDGTFTVRMALPNGRQIIPAVAISPDGLEERTIVLAVERNTKTLEPVLRELVAEA
jgi:hypothetical protein